MEILQLLITLLSYLGIILTYLYLAWSCNLIKNSLYSLEQKCRMGNQQSTIIEAVAVINSGKIQGTVVFTQKEEHTSIRIDVKGLKKNAKHGFHIHETGDLREGCKSCCAHYNPDNTEHAGLEGGHAGDLGNIKTDDAGICDMTIHTNKFKIDDKTPSSSELEPIKISIGVGFVTKSF
jgi:Cu/Zn superoxide dismutase